MLMLQLPRQSPGRFHRFRIFPELIAISVTVNRTRRLEGCPSFQLPMKRLLHPFSVLSLGLGLSQLPLRAQDAAPANPPPSPPADGGGARRNPAQMMQQLKDRLGLSDDQARQLAQIFQEMRT